MSIHLIASFLELESHSEEAKPTQVNLLAETAAHPLQLGGALPASALIIGDTVYDLLGGHPDIRY
ncbi:hypothetical protein MTX78_03480 [Hymenobacter tibetensis]|uniref:Cytochrome b5 heme-binding domain-containing protein n=1 Tax=Hymenobacter tibetensis TaxID=497967 RepID=A0ABY4D2D8_9BACT|nr:hypothetical protein [Hymenobacter tibetensis]UOG75660.1 hypothetical protein MTX78_03480 [Hymenobacter tibetensis]